MSEAFLSVCCIIRDAEATLGPLLDDLLVSLPEDGPNARAGEPALDELVLVDTGSTDATRELVLDRVCRGTDAADRVVWPRDAAELEGHDETPRSVAFYRPDGLKVVLAQFDWVKHFARARNFSYELASGLWRGYFDSDDRFPFAARLKPTLRSVEREREACGQDMNCLVLPYDYDPGVVRQDVVRFVRWGNGQGRSQNGWVWEGRIHETQQNWARNRVHVPVPDLLVEHHPPEGHGGRSIARNEEYVRQAYEESTGNEKCRMAYYLAKHLRCSGKHEEAVAYYREAARMPGNFAGYALTHLADYYQDKERWQEAIEAAGAAAARCPESPEPLAKLAVVHSLAQDHLRAVMVWENMKRRPPAAIKFMHDSGLMSGIAPSQIALSYLALGRVDEAYALVNSVPPVTQRQAEVHPLYRKAYRATLKAYGAKVLEAWVKFLVWSCEPAAASDLMCRLPETISSLPQVRALHDWIRTKTRHLESWEDYQACYRGISPDPFSQELAIAGAKAFGRTAILLDWARSLPAEGPPVRVLSIGVWSGAIEALLLEANPRIHLTAADLDELPATAGVGVPWLKDRYPGRVDGHTVKDWECDWPEGRFDAIVFFEVLEHMESAGVAIEELVQRLVPRGVLFLSTPHSEHWIEPHLTDPRLAPPFYGHVRGYSPARLLEEIEFQGPLRVEAILGTDQGSVLVTKAVKETRPFAPHVRGRNQYGSGDVSILVSNAPKAFDRLSLSEGHLGGSEEAVVHLSEALAAQGVRVTVYTRLERVTPVPHYLHGVLWRPLEEFYLEDERNVLVWRNPKLAAELARSVSGPRPSWKRGDAPKVFNWLHDTTYGASPVDYEAVAGTFVLSRAHAKILEETDGFKGPFLFAQNGIDLDSFPLPDESKRNLHKVVYGSSPDRGLAVVMEMWPRIRAAVPGAELHVFYGFDFFWKRCAMDPDFERTYGGAYRKLEAAVRNTEGVVYHGGVSHEVLHEHYRTAGVWFYPTSFYEISCITAMKAMACGCSPVTTDVGALPETLGDYLLATEDDRTFTDSVEDLQELELALIEMLEYPQGAKDRRAMIEKARERFDWARAARMFREGIFEEPAK